VRGYDAHLCVRGQDPHHTRGRHEDRGRPHQNTLITHHV